MSKLWNVSYTIEAVVYADDETSAREAVNMADDDLAPSNYEIATAGRFLPFRYMPDGWDEDAMPWGGEDDETIAKILERLKGEKAGQ